MALNRRDLADGFRAMGLQMGDSVLVHSSMRSLGYVEGGAQTVVASLCDAVGPDGLVIFPTLTGRQSDSPQTPPVFDVRATRCWTGRIPEYARQLPQALRSLHPTHSVASIGSRKEMLAEGHDCGASPCDAKSPYYKNAVWRGYIMLIGVDEESNTTVHCCEELANVPYHLQKSETVMHMTDANGTQRTLINRLHDWDKPETNFNFIERLFSGKDILKNGRVGSAQIRLLHADRMLDTVVDKLLQNPEYLIVR